jgi:anti-sigma B factor antagonist
MQIVERRLDSVTVLRLKGRLVYEDGFEDLRQALDRAVADSGNVVLNFDEVTYLDSAGVGLIAGKYATALRCGGKLKLSNLQRRSYRVLETTKLLTIFESFDTEADAVRSFGAQPC